MLMLYDNVKEETHPVTVSYYSRDIKRLVDYTVKSPLTLEALHQELRASMKSGRKYAYESDYIRTSFADDGASVVGA